MNNTQKSRFFLISLFLTIFISISFLTRTVLLLKSFDLVNLDFLVLAKMYAIGMFYDVIAFSYFIIPFILYMIFAPNRLFNSKIHQYFLVLVIFLQIYGFLFGGVSEWFFWDEFGKRFNFIAVDYLVYTQEVVKNIVESYPIGLLLSSILALSLFILFFLIRRVDFFHISFAPLSFAQRLKIGVVFLLIPLIAFFALTKQNLSEISNNTFNNELAKNGLYSLFSAFFNNSLDYNEFYATKPDDILFKEIQKLQGFNLKEPKQVISTNKEIKPNVILIMVESLSAEYMGIYGDKKNLTPNLDAIAIKSLFFDNIYATGTRTVRGMEAVTLSIPPTPGRSIVKRPNNENLFSSGFIFQSKGYENKFIYAGHGYFDNMNYFFSHNGFSTIDRLDFQDNEITFSNAWGVCDEDLLTKTLNEADKSYENQKPFFTYVMTTSNHRPYTYPEGKIDIPSHSGRDGAVKYTDFAIGEFLKNAQNKPWFDNTIFIIVADHNGGSAGKSELPIWRYKIPLIVYAPKLIDAQNISKLASQIDVMPTLFSLMGWSYPSMFYGNDILSDNFIQRALIGNYQKLGYVKDNFLTILNPDKSLQEYEITNQTLTSSEYKEITPKQEDVLDAITLYQSASYMYKHKLDLWKE